MSEVTNVKPQLPDEENKIATLKASIQEGTKSGIANGFNSKEHLVLLKANKISKPS